MWEQHGLGSVALTSIMMVCPRISRLLVLLILIRKLLATLTLSDRAVKVILSRESHSVGCSHETVSRTCESSTCISGNSTGAMPAQWLPTARLLGVHIWIYSIKYALACVRPSLYTLHIPTAM